MAEWLQKNPLNYGVVSKAPGISAYIGNGQGVPRGWVISAEGKIVFSGKPADITDAMVEEWLKDCPAAQIEREVCAKLRPAVKSYNTGKYGKALKDAEELEQSEDETVKADASFIAERVRKAIGWRKDAAKRLAEDKEWVKLHTLLSEDAVAYAGCEYGDECKEKAKTLKGEDKYKEAVAAEKMLGKITEQGERLKGEALNRELDKLIDKYPDTAAADRAKAMKQ